MAVVLFHTNLDDIMIHGTLLVDEGQFPIYKLFSHLLTYELALITVPLFFFISGFLFFYDTDFSMTVYRRKLKTRVRTLLIPYVFWNVAVFFMLFLTQQFFSSMTSGSNKLIADYNWLDWLNLFWAHRNGLPVCYQFWFIRDLMVVVLLAPVLYYFIKYCKGYVVLVLAGLWLFGFWFDVPGISISAFFFFSFGAWFGINKRNFTADFSLMRWPITFFYLALAGIDTWLWHCKVTDYSFINNIVLVAGLVTIVSWTAYGINKNRLRVSVFLAGSSFFVYAYHGMPVTLATKYWVKLIQPASEWTMLVGFFLIPLFIVGLGVGLYALLRRSFPALTALITGKR